MGKIDPSQPVLKTKNGYYYGTEIGASGARYTKDGWFSRGNSEIWVDLEGIHFRRYLTRRIMHIPINSISGITIGTEHAGKWFGAPTIKITWNKDDSVLVSGFTISWDKKATDEWVAVIDNLIRQAQ